MKTQTSNVVALIVALSFSLAPGLAQSTDYESMLHGFLGRGKIDSHTMSVVLTNLNTRQGQLEQEIAAGVASGQLTPGEEAELKTQLTGIANLQGQYLASGGGKLNNIQIQDLLNQLTALTTKLNAYLTNSTTVANATTRHDRWFSRYNKEGWGWDRMSEGHIDSYQAELLASIQQALTQGKISVATAQSLRAQLNVTENKQREMTADGRLSRSESDQLMASLDTVKANLNQEIANAARQYNHGHHYGWGMGWNNDPTRIAYGQSMLRQRIYDGLRSGRLSRAEADRLLSDEQRIQQLESQMTASGGRLTWSEQRQLIAERDNLNKQINQELTDHNAW